MHCFNHPEYEAVGLCKECSKGLCTNCANDLGHGLACKGRHEEAVNLLHSIASRNANVQASMPRNIAIAPLFYLFMGLTFISWGIFSNRPSFFSVVLGAGFVVFAVVVYRVNKRAFIQGSPASNTSLKADVPDGPRP